MSQFDTELRQEQGVEAPSPVCWPQWAEDARLDDALAAAAYEATPAHLRAAVKTGLALAHMLACCCLKKTTTGRQSANALARPAPRRC